MIRLLSATVLVPALLLTQTFTLWSEPEDASGSDEGRGVDVGLDVGIGVRTFRNPAYDGPEGDEPRYRAYQSLRLLPELSIGRFGAGLDLTINYTFTGGDDGNSLEVRREDWVPDEDRNFAELYLPKIRYLRWARKGDPLFVRFGQLDNAVLGSGFILGGYTNTHYLPERAQFGLEFDVDGRLFDFPYAGIETVASNVAAADLLGGRLFLRPLADLDMPLLPDLELGSTVVTDRRPYYHAAIEEDEAIEEDDESVLIWGFDLRQPIANRPSFSLTAFADVARQHESWGSALGAGGRLFGFLNYTGQLRAVGDNFIPRYFDSGYDLYRRERYAVYIGDVESPGYFGWLAGTGTAFLQDRLAFNASIEGAFGPLEPPVDEHGHTRPAALARNPMLRASFIIDDGVIPGITAQANYEKRNITDFGDLVSPENAVIGARINVRTGPAVISLLYDLRYDPFATDDDRWKVNSGLESTITLF